MIIAFLSSSISIVEFSDPIPKRFLGLPGMIASPFLHALAPKHHTMALHIFSLLGVSREYGHILLGLGFGVSRELRKTLIMGFRVSRE